jgi:beta-hydroxyacyl-ACP dehydratase FabZ
VPQLGGVVIGDDCEIGANTTIDRGALEDTILEEDVRLDNQIQVGHNVVIGAHTAMAGCAAIAGSAKVGRYCLIGGGAGILGHLELCDRVIVTAMSLVTHSIREPGEYSSGTPIMDNRSWRKSAARFKQLDALARRVAARTRIEDDGRATPPRRGRAPEAAAAPLPVPAGRSRHRVRANKRILGIKNVTINEPFFQGHFPGHPVMPGVLVIEALAQTGGILTQLSHQAAATDKLFYLVKIDNAKFSRMVVPGDRLELHVELKRTIRNMALYQGIARVDGEQVACAEILCAEVKG